MYHLVLIIWCNKILGQPYFISLFWNRDRNADDPMVPTTDMGSPIILVSYGFILSIPLWRAIHLIQMKSGWWNDSGK